MSNDPTKHPLWPEFRQPVESGFGPGTQDVVRERESIDRTERLISALERLTETIQALLERESDS